MHAREFANQRTQARAIARVKAAWHLGFEQLTTTDTVPLVQLEVRDLHLDRGQFNDLVRVIRHRGDKPAMATLTTGGINHLHCGGLK